MLFDQLSAYICGCSRDPTYGQHQMEVLRLKADLGDDHARRSLDHWLARMRGQTR